MGPCVSALRPAAPRRASRSGSMLAPTGPEPPRFGPSEELELEDGANAEARAAREAALKQRVETVKLMLDHLPLRFVLKDATLLHAFREFTKSQHASENLLFYLAVEKFRKHKYIRPNHDLQGILEEAEATPMRPSTNVDVTRMHLNMARSLQLPMSQVSAIMDALRIYETFLQEGARMWVCVSPEVLQEIQEVLLKEPQLVKQQSVFAKASDEAFLTMERDILPRFVEACRDEELLDRMAYYARMLQSRAKAKEKKPRFMPPSVGSSLRRRSEAFKFRRPRSTNSVKSDRDKASPGKSTALAATADGAGRPIGREDDGEDDGGDLGPKLAAGDTPDFEVVAAPPRARTPKNRRGFRHQLRALSSG